MPLVAGFLNFLATLGKLLPFLLGHRLESHGAVRPFDQLGERGGHHTAGLLGLRRVPVDGGLVDGALVDGGLIDGGLVDGGLVDGSLSGPSARRPRAFVIAAILVGRFNPVLPLPVRAMLPTLVGVEWVVAMPAGLK